MAVFKVKARMTAVVEAEEEIEAESADEAKKISAAMSWSDFSRWEVVRRIESDDTAVEPV